MPPSKRGKGHFDHETSNSDLRRLGLFKETGYLHSTYRYIPLDNFIWNKSAHRGKQMQISFNGCRDSSNRGYFGDFIRSFEGEAISDPMKEYRRDKRAARDKFYAGDFICASPGKKLYGGGSGHWWGTFSGPTEAFSSAPREREKASTTEKRFLVEPGKKGSGYGYPDCTTDPYPSALNWGPDPRTKMSEPTNNKPFFMYYSNPPTYLYQNPYYTDPRRLPKISKRFRKKPFLYSFSVPQPFKPASKGKVLGGSKDGCFTPYSEYATRLFPVKSPRKIKYEPMTTGAANTSTFVSTIQTNVKKQVTPKTYKDVDGVMYLKPGLQPNH